MAREREHSNTACYRLSLSSLTNLEGPGSSPPKKVKDLYHHPARQLQNSRSILRPPLPLTEENNTGEVDTSTVKVVPLLLPSDEQVTVPCIASTTFLQIASASPVPPCLSLKLMV